MLQHHSPVGARVDSPAERLDEHDRVALIEAISDEEVTLPVGSVGTIVSIWVPGEVFLVEFTQPSAIVMLERHQVSLFERLHH